MTLSEHEIEKAIQEAKFATDKVIAQAKVDEVILKVYETQLKIRDLELLGTQESLRPCNMQQANVIFDPNENVYRCQTFSPDEDELPIVGYGDSPEEACTNFDIIWIRGRRQE